MIIQATAPSRISLFGGGTDVPSYYEKYGGLVISMAINLKQHITLYTEQDIYSITDNKIPNDANPKFLYAATSEFGIGSMHHCKFESAFDAVIGAGLGSSASALVAMIGAINKAQGLNMTKNEIAEKAWDIEVKKLGKYGGKQDQYASVYGGVNTIEFKKDGVDVTPLARSFMEKLYPAMVLFYLGKRKNTKTQEGFKDLTGEQIEALTEIKKLAIQSIDVIGRGDIEGVGGLMHLAWEYKKKSNKVSNDYIDQFYTKGLENGAYGGKLLGSGSGGYMLFIVDPEKRKRFIHKMGENTDFSIDYNGLEARIL